MTKRYFALSLHTESDFPSVFACIVDLSLKQNDATGWTDSVTKTGKNNNGFSTLRVHNEDKMCITPIFGSVRRTQNLSTQYMKISTNNTYLMNCIEGMQLMDKKIQDLVVTSPPYDDLRTYNDSSKWDFDVFKDVAKGLVRVLKDI